MHEDRKTTLHGIDEEKALRTILQGTAIETGEHFFTALVKNLATVLGTHIAWVSRYLESSRELQPFAFWLGDEWIAIEKYHLEDTPCEDVIDNTSLIHIPDNLVRHYPEHSPLVDLGAVSYLGVPLLDLNGKILGHMAVIDTVPMPEKPRSIALFQIFAARAAAELQRMRAEAEVKAREAKLSRLFGSTMDAIVELNDDFQITLMNRAGKKIFGTEPDAFEGTCFSRFVSENGLLKIKGIINQLNGQAGSERFLWIPGGFQARTSVGLPFEAEATLSRSVADDGNYFTLILRNVNERLEAEKKIQSLITQTEYLKEEIKSVHNFGNMIGQSVPIQRVFQDIKEVAATDATVLILGETGTGKELVARAIHAKSRRHDKPFIKVNCAAIPANLIESEFFGHEQGAFTGATKKRAGRFTLAHKGTIFLDEIGDLPIDLQVKLLRVLQEGAFEPLGSSYTTTVDVRVIAATHWDLLKASKEGNFREDLYYRLNVFPIEVPPLRERHADIAPLSISFVEKFSKKMGRPRLKISKESLECLTRYDWPGNVRELENIIERAVITSSGKDLDLHRALPMTSRIMAGEDLPDGEMTSRIRTIQELQDVERNNLILALKKTGGKVSGQNGAAKLLGMNQSTLSSRMKVLKIKQS